MSLEILIVEHLSCHWGQKFVQPFEKFQTRPSSWNQVQSDALSRRSDFYLDEDNDNEDVTLLPDDLFVNLINIDLQCCIAASDTNDWTAADAIKLLQADGPTEAQTDLSD